MNKITVIIAVAAFIIGEAVGFALGFATGRNRPGDPPVQSQQGAASASADAAQENSRRSAAEADAFRTFARQRIEDLDRLEILAANDRLYDVEKIEIGKIIDFDIAMHTPQRGAEQCSATRGDGGVEKCAADATRTEKGVEE